jgi:hypothetical protein
MGTIAVLSAAGLAAGLALTGAPAASAVTLPDDGVLHQRLERFCTRVPDLIERGEKLGPRLAGDAETRGSLKFLQARIDRNEKEGHQWAAKRLEVRLERRTVLSQKLPAKLDALRKAKTECAAAGLGGTS